MSKFVKQKKKNWCIWYISQHKSISHSRNHLWIYPQTSILQISVFWQCVQSNFTLISPNLLTFTQSKLYSVQLRRVQRELQTWKSNNSTNKKSNFPICFIYVTHAFRQGTYLQASGGPCVEEHLIPNRTPLLILNGMEILEILNNSTWATRVTLDEAENNHLTNVITPTIAIWQLKLWNLPVAESQKLI